MLVRVDVVACLVRRSFVAKRTTQFDAANFCRNSGAKRGSETAMPRSSFEMRVLNSE